MNFKKEISDLRTRLSGASASLSSIIRGVRLNKPVKQELVAIEEIINKSTATLEEIETRLEKNSGKK